MTDKRFELNNIVKKGTVSFWDTKKERILNASHTLDLLNEQHETIQQLKQENKELKKQLRREETDKKRLMSYLMRYKGFGFDEMVEDFLDEPYYDNWWEDGFYECCWDEYLKEKGFDGCAEE